MAKNHVGVLGAAAVLLAAVVGPLSTPYATAAGNPELSPRESNGRVELIGPDGQLRYWVDRFGRVHSPEMTLAADSYNQWIITHYSGLLGPATPTGGVEFISHVPPGLRGIDWSSGVFRIPREIFSDGALTRDLLSVPFFQLGVRLIGQWNALLADCKQINANDANAQCARFAPNMAVTDAGAAGVVDDHWMELRLRELQKARAALQGMQHVLEGVPMVAPGGQSFAYKDDIARYPERLKECWTILSAAPQINIFSDTGEYCTLHPEFAAHPPEWTAEYIEGEAVTPQLARVLHSFEWQIGNYLDAENVEADLTAQSLGLPATR